MPDSKVGTTIQGGQIQGIASAGTVVIENFTIYNRAVEEPAITDAAGEPIAPCPYPGLAYFGPGDADLFFGRDAAIARLAEAVGRQRLTVLVGASGSGKSSVVLAGLAPRLHGAGDWRFSHFRIGTELDGNPFLALGRAVVPLYETGVSDTERLKNTKQLASSLETGELSLLGVFTECRARNKGKRILLIADQFEEAFTLVEDETVRRRFIEVLLAGFPNAKGGRSPVICLILTLRGDFYGQALRNRPFADALQGHVENLGPMSRDELRAAIVYPAAKAEVTFESGLVETLLDNLDNAPGRLPLLQFALREMWGRQEKRKITRKSYDEIGGVQSWLRQIKPNIDFWLANPDDDGPLLRGSMLGQATELLATRLDDLSSSEKNYIQASLALEKRVSGERIFLDTLMRSLDLSAWADHAKDDLGRMNQLQEFITLISADNTNGLSSTRFLHQSSSADNLAEQDPKKQGRSARGNRRYDAALNRLPRVSQHGIWYRPIQLRFVSTALSSAHTREITSRFNPGPLLERSKRFASLSFAEDTVTGMFEAGVLFGRADQPGGMVPHPQLASSFTMIAVQVNLQSTIDLFDEENIRLVQISSQELTGDWGHYSLQKDLTRMAPTQVLGEEIFRMKVEGFLAPSARVPFKRILVVFPENFAPGSSLLFQDAAGKQVLSV